MEKFRGVDYYGIDGLLSEEERMIRDTVRDWVEAEFLPIVPSTTGRGRFRPRSSPSSASSACSAPRSRATAAPG